MFSGSTHLLPSIHHYHAARTHWDKTITPQELVKSIERQISEQLKLNRRSGLVELPQFMPHVDYPRSNVLVKENP